MIHTLYRVNNNITERLYNSEWQRNQKKAENLITNKKTLSNDGYNLLDQDIIIKSREEDYLTSMVWSNVLCKVMV